MQKEVSSLSEAKASLAEFQTLYITEKGRNEQLTEENGRLNAKYLSEVSENQKLSHYLESERKLVDELRIEIIRRDDDIKRIDKLGKEEKESSLSQLVKEMKMLRTIISQVSFEAILSYVIVCA